MEKLCVNCKHHRETVRGAHECFRLCTQKHVRSNVDGSRVSVCTALPSSCSRERDTEGRCGLDALNFVPSRAKWFGHKVYLFQNSKAFAVMIGGLAATAAYYLVI